MSSTQMQPQRLSFSQYVRSKEGQGLMCNAIDDKRKRDAVTTAIISAVSINPSLLECTYPSIISAALQGISMNLSPSPQLGQFYMMPFKNNKEGTFEARFVPGYKGYIQLAYRSGQYVDIDAQPVVDGEYKGRDRQTGRHIFEWIEDYAEAERRPISGYMAFFELINGAKKTLYWPKEKMIAHADRYAPSFSRDATKIKARGQWKTKVSFEDFLAGNYPKEDEWMYSSFWYKDFSSMAKKTMLRQLISQWGPVSIEMGNAIIQDTQNEAQGVDYGADFSAAALPAPQEPDVFEDAAENTPDPPSKAEEQVSLNDI